jgi:hypothetical protein
MRVRETSGFGAPAAPRRIYMQFILLRMYVCQYTERMSVWCMEGKISVLLKISVLY